MRSEGRAVKEGCQAMKFVKMRAGTLGRTREIELLREGFTDAEAAGTKGGAEAAERDLMQGLYARNQTELYTPDPVVNVS
jgi:xeroderma pigmentosum group C-complementing protein